MHEYTHHQLKINSLKGPAYLSTSIYATYSSKLISLCLNQAISIASSKLHRFLGLLPTICKKTCLNSSEKSILVFWRILDQKTCSFLSSSSRQLGSATLAAAKGKQPAMQQNSRMPKLQTSDLKVYSVRLTASGEAQRQSVTNLVRLSVPFMAKPKSSRSGLYQSSRTMFSALISPCITFLDRRQRKVDRSVFAKQRQQSSLSRPWLFMCYSKSPFEKKGVTIMLTRTGSPPSSLKNVLWRTSTMGTIPRNSSLESIQISLLNQDPELGRWWQTFTAYQTPSLSARQTLFGESCTLPDRRPGSCGPCVSRWLLAQAWEGFTRREKAPM